MNAKPFELGVLDAAEHLASGAVTSVELMRALLDRADQMEPSLNSLCWRDRELALAAARAADEARAAGDARPWLGVPLAVKDVLNVAGQPCTAGSAILQGYVAPYDATVVARLKAAGFILFARANTDEFAMGSSTETSVYGPTRNPWDAERTPGGSSGGSAAVVAARLAPAALGTDTSGSIRQPAAFCGVTGFKPTTGRISRFGCVALAPSLDQIGAIARCVEDAAVLYQVMAGVDPRDAMTSAREVEMDLESLCAASDLKGVRLGWVRSDAGTDLDPDVEALVRAAVKACRELGAEVIEVDLPHQRYGLPCYSVLASAEASASLARYDGVRYGRRVPADDLQEMMAQTRAQGFGREVKRRLILGTHVLSRGGYERYYERACKVRELIRRDYARVFEQCDALVGPVAPTAAWRLGEPSADPPHMVRADTYTVGANLAGLCALSLPCGFTATGLPVGLQVVGPAFEDARVLRIGAAYQHATEWHWQRPGLGEES